MEASNNKHKYYNRWLVAMAYLLVIIIWSTTPLTIKWSGDGVSYLFGFVLRMLIGAVIAMLLALLMYKKIPVNKSALQAYAASALALFGGMLPVYWGAQYISSGLISVIFGLSPMVTGYLSWRFINEQGFNAVKITGGLLGVVGLMVIFLEDSAIGDNYLYGVASVLFAVFIHCASAVWIKSIKVDMPPLSLVAGGLLFSMPLFITVYLIYAPPLPAHIPEKAIWSIVYLGVVGSVLGFVSYYYLLKHLATSTVALITLITPVTALWIGYVLNAEVLSAGIYTGTGFVLTGLALHQWGDVLSNRLWKKRNIYYG